MDFSPADIPTPLPLAIALCIIRMGAAIVAPVVWIAIQPGPLRTTLVVPIVGVGLELGSLPLALSRTLAVGRRAIGLTGNLRATLEDLATVHTTLGHHRISTRNQRRNPMVAEQEPYRKLGDHI